MTEVLQMDYNNICYFSSDEERNNLLISWGIAAKRNIDDKVFYYMPTEEDVCECSVVGYIEYGSIHILVVEANHEIHKIVAAYFKEMQKSAKQFYESQNGVS